MTNKKEQKLYDKFVDKVLELLEKAEITDKELRVILNFIESQNLQANPDENERLKELKEKFTLDLPFDIEELPLEK